MAGITAAIEAAEVGYEVILIEKKPYLGGRVAMLNQYFPKLCPPYCGLEINFNRIRNNKNIRIITRASVKDIQGSEGNYVVSVTHETDFVNSNCTSCGKCVKVCPVERKNEFNYGLDTTKAIFLPHEMAFPFKYTIDKESCLKGECNKCRDVCEYNAIDFTVQCHIETIEAGSVIVATGWKSYDANKLSLYNYQSSDRIITNMEFERLASFNGPDNSLLKENKTSSKIQTVAFAQCAGSRDENHLPYCSGVCCSATLKQALFLREHFPEVIVKIFYIDLRVSGRNEDFLMKAQQDQKIQFIKGKIAEAKANTNSNKVVIEAEDMMAGKKISELVDLLVLATGIVPEDSLAKSLIRDKNGFLIPNNEKGILSAGCAVKPMDVAHTVRDATGKTLQAIQINRK